MQGRDQILGLFMCVSEGLESWNGSGARVAMLVRYGVCRELIIFLSVPV